MDYYVISLSLIILGVFIIPKGYLTVELFKECNKHRKLNVTGKFFCYMPIRNSYIITSSLYGPSMWMAVLTVLLPIFIVIPVIVSNFMAEPSLAMRLPLVLLFNISLLGWYILEVVQTWRVATLLDMKKYHRIFFAPALAQFLLARRVRLFFNKNRDLAEGTFDV